MLKLIEYPNNTLESSPSYNKCSEIHYFTSNFNIICIICRELYQEYQQFLKHFQDLHLVEFMRNTKNGCDKDDVLYENNQIAKTITQKCVKQELPEFTGQSQNNKEMIKPTIMDELIPDVYDEDISYGEMFCKLENAQQQVTSEMEYAANQIDVSGIESVTNYNLKDKSSEINWSYSCSPNHIKHCAKRPYKPRNQPNSCSYCGKIFRRRYQLDTHLNIHTGLKPHQCDICGRQFRAITTLQRHLSTHDKHQIYSCQFCSKEFTHRAALVSHETRHTQERSIPCEDCHKMFYTHNQLDTHRRKMHHKTDDFSLPYACEFCPKRYRSASMLSTHKFKKHYKMAKFVCEDCGKKFVEQNQLNIHKSSIHFKKC